MARPTKPGWYWLNVYGVWEIVQVGRELQVYRTDYEGSWPVAQYADDQWGGEITQLPAPDPPPPF